MIVAKALCSTTIQSVGVRAKKLKIENGKLKIIKQGKQMIVAKALCSTTIQSVGVLTDIGGGILGRTGRMRMMWCMLKSSLTARSGGVRGAARPLCPCHPSM